ncbi:DUF3024 domain-containing protein [Nocardia niigatensis]
MSMNNVNNEPNQLPPGALELVERWRIQTIPEAEEDERKLEVEPDGATITIHEHLGMLEEDWIRRPIAKLCYQQQVLPMQAWTLFCVGQHDGWYPCEDFLRPSLPFAGTLEDALTEIAEDRDGRFFGTF